ncbi:MAG TPA: hypothetical protein VE988_00495 [Gemmataceae bacterium]|nr:hypothetical protein [Gemmataceae bacterium]
MVDEVEEEQPRVTYESAAVTANITVALWSAQDAKGRPSFHWSVTRAVNPLRHNRAFLPETLFEFPELVRVLARRFGQSDILDDAQRARFVLLAGMMEQVIGKLFVNLPMCDLIF